MLLLVPVPGSTTISTGLLFDGYYDFAHNLKELEKIVAANLADRVLATLSADNTDRQMQLAALARAVASLAADELEEEANTA